MVRYTKRRNTRRNTRSRGGTALPLSYFTGKAPVSADAGRNFLVSEGMGVRPKIGGKRSRRRRTRSKHSRRRGGFVPSVMGNFMASASKYIVPIALFAGYKMVKKSGLSFKKRRTRRR